MITQNQLAQAQSKPTVPSVTLVQPFKDPDNTYRATSVQQMSYVVPALPLNTFYSYDIGTQNNIQTIIYSLQNNAVSHSLAVTASLPGFLNLTINPTFTILPREIVNVKLMFNEAGTTALFPKNYLTTMSFDIFPLNVQGPVWIDRNAVPPPNLNLIDVGNLPVTGSVSSSVPQIVYKYVTIEIPPPPIDTTPQLFWKNGQTGEITSGSPPQGWVIEADGAAYPPIEPQNPCGGPSGGPGNGATDAQTLMDEIINVPLAKPAAHRSPIILTTGDITGIIAGDPNDIVVNSVIPIWIMDLGPGNGDVKTQNYSKKTFDGTAVNPTNETIGLYTNIVDQVVGRMRNADVSPHSATNIFELLIELCVAEANVVIRNGKIAFSGIEEVGTYPNTTVVNVLANDYQHAFNTAASDIQSAYKGLHYRAATTAVAILTFAGKNNI